MYFKQQTCRAANICIWPSGIFYTTIREIFENTFNAIGTKVPLLSHRIWTTSKDLARSGLPVDFFFQVLKFHWAYSIFPLLPAIRMSRIWNLAWCECYHERFAVAPFCKSLLSSGSSEIIKLCSGLTLFSTCLIRTAVWHCHGQRWLHRGSGLSHACWQGWHRLKWHRWRSRAAWWQLGGILNPKKSRNEAF